MWPASYRAARRKPGGSDGADRPGRGPCRPVTAGPVSQPAPPSGLLTVRPQSAPAGARARSHHSKASAAEAGSPATRVVRRRSKEETWRRRVRTPPGSRISEEHHRDGRRMRRTAFGDGVTPAAGEPVGEAAPGDVRVGAGQQGVLPQFGAEVPGVQRARRRADPVRGDHAVRPREAHARTRPHGGSGPACPSARPALHRVKLPGAHAATRSPVEDVDAVAGVDQGDEGDQRRQLLLVVLSPPSCRFTQLPEAEPCLGPFGPFHRAERRRGSGQASGGARHAHAPPTVTAPQHVPPGEEQGDCWFVHAC